MSDTNLNCCKTCGWIMCQCGFRPKDRANEPAPGESDASLCSAPAGKGAANDTDVQPTAGAMIAQWMDENAALIWYQERFIEQGKRKLELLQHTRAEVSKILDAIHASTGS